MTRTEKLEMLLRCLARDIDDEGDPTFVSIDTTALVGDLLRETPAHLVVSDPCWQGTISLVPEES